MQTARDFRKIRCWDGLHFSFQLLHHHYSSLWETCCKIPTENPKLIPALAGCWGFIDALHRIREIAQSVPDLSVKAPEMRAFLSATKVAEDGRHYIQHLRNELANDPPNTFPVWGSISWVDYNNRLKSHIVSFGAQIPGNQITGCVYDRLENRYVSKVCLGVRNLSFNFDPIYASVQRFEHFIMPLLVTWASDRVHFHDTLNITSVEITLEKRLPNLP